MLQLNLIFLAFAMVLATVLAWDMRSEAPPDEGAEEAADEPSAAG